MLVVGGVPAAMTFSLYLAFLLFAIRSTHQLAPLSFRLPGSPKVSPSQSPPTPEVTQLTQEEGSKVLEASTQEEVKKLLVVPVVPMSKTRVLLGVMFGVAALLFTITALLACVTLASIATRYQGDQFLVLVLSTVGTISATSTSVALLRPTTSEQPRQKPTCCGQCCVMGAYPMAVILLVITTLHMAKSAGALTAPAFAVPGNLHGVGGEEKMHMYCEGEVNSSKPTVLYVHGWTGSGFDAVHVWRAPAVVELGVRFCVLDRPGYGFSPPYKVVEEERHFGHVAQMTLALIRAEGIQGDIVLLYHSLGGYHVLALADALRTDGGSDVRLVAGVACDAMDPDWFEWDARRPAENCDTAVALPAYNFLNFWTLVDSGQPSGLVRIIYSSGFGGFDALVNLVPDDWRDRYFANAMSASYFDAVQEEDRRWDINCGHAKPGMIAAADWRYMEVISCPQGLNLTKLGRMNANSVTLIVPDEVGHAELLFDKRWAELYVAPALARAVRFVSA
jgi:pimeloyl-ACP methyl ester carboxylesterase